MWKNTTSSEQDFSNWDTIRLNDYLTSLEKSKDWRDKLIRKKVRKALWEKTIECSSQDEYIQKIIEVEMNLVQELQAMWYQKSKTPSKENKWDIVWANEQVEYYTLDWWEFKLPQENNKTKPYMVAIRKFLSHSSCSVISSSADYTPSLEEHRTKPDYGSFSIWSPYGSVWPRGEIITSYIIKNLSSKVS